MNTTNNTTSLPEEANEAPWNENHSPSAKTGVLDKTGDKLREIKDNASHTASDLADGAKRHIHDTSENAKVRYTEAREQAALKASETKQSVVNSFERRPLVYLAGALAAGVALGLAIPRSRKERQSLASSGEKLREAAIKAKDETTRAAKSATEAATEKFEEKIQGGTEEE